VEPIKGGLTSPLGFKACGVAAGLKRSGKPDLALLVSDTSASVAGVFTTNQVQAAPVLVSRERVAAGVLDAVVINSGNANACTGEVGLRDAEAMCRGVAEVLDLAPTRVAVCSTGVIGVPMPIDDVLGALPGAASLLDRSGGADLAGAMMTTDTFRKEAAVRCAIAGREYTIGGAAKGAGMIRPDMATMLCLITTDAPLTPAACKVALKSAVGHSFNRITVDGETSTNDTVLMLANGSAGGDDIGPGDPGFDILSDAVACVCSKLARLIVEDGEGATKFIEVTVTGAVSDEDAATAATAIAQSPLFKTAIFGQDPNWGRVMSAVGASRAKIDPDTIEVRFGDVVLASRGVAVPFDEDKAAAALTGREVSVRVDLGVGDGEACVWTCDLTYDYIRINAEYDRLKPAPGGGG